MKTSTLSNCLAVLVLGALMLGTGLPGYASEPVTPIPWEGSTSLPDYVGAPAKAHPTANSGVPQDPFLAPYPFAHSHSDIWMSDVVDIAGPLGINPVTLSTTMAEARKYPESWLIPCGSMGFDSHGRPIINCFGLNEASVIMLDPDTLEVLAHQDLEVTPGPPFGRADQKIVPSMYSIYGYVDNLDQVHIVSGSKKILVLRVTDSPSGPEFKEVPELEFDLTQLAGSTNDLISGVMMDFQGRYWINMRKTANIYLLNPATYHGISDLQSINLGEGEFTRNGLVLTKEGAAYIVTSEAMYRVDAGADDTLTVAWRQEYNTSWGRDEPPDYRQRVRPGQYELGSGATPTILGEGKYVAITDNAKPQMQVTVFRTDERLDPGEERIVCEVPVFDFPGGGAGANSNSLNGLRNSIVVQNTADYLFNWETGELEVPSKPGIERIDIDPNGKGCTKVWVNQEVASIMLPKLSTKTGLIYTQDRKWDTQNEVYAYYWVALDFRTGEVVWEKLAGTGVEFENFWAPMGVGPNGALYGSQYGGMTMIRDTR